MEALEAIKSVKSVSKYKPDPVPEQKVQAVVNAARFAVSADPLGDAIQPALCRRIEPGHDGDAP